MCRLGPGSAATGAQPPRKPARARWRHAIDLRSPQMSTVKCLPPGVSAEASFYRTLPEHGPVEDLHAHQETITVHVLEGVIYLVSEEDERPMTPGDVAVLRPGELHRVFNAGDGEAHFLEGVRPDDCAS